MFNVNITETAEKDILDAAVYIAHNLSNIIAANRLLDDSDVAAKSLSNFPMRYPLVRDDLLASKGLRSLSIKNYLMFYVVREDRNNVNVIRFIHSRRDWAKLFDESMFDDL